MLWADGKLRLRDIGAFALTLLVCALPALLGGKSLEAIVSYYTGQTGLYTGLTYNAPNLYLFFPMLEFASSQEYTWMRYIGGVDGAGTNAYLTEDLFPRRGSRSRREPSEE